MRWRIRRQQQSAWQSVARGRPQACQPICNQCAETVAEEHVRLIESRSQLVIDLVNQLAQRSESLAVENLDGNDLDAGAKRPAPGAEHRSTAPSVVEAEQSHVSHAFRELVVLREHFCVLLHLLVQITVTR